MQSRIPAEIIEKTKESQPDVVEKAMRLQEELSALIYSQNTNLSWQEILAHQLTLKTYNSVQKIVKPLLPLCITVIFKKVSVYTPQHSTVVPLQCLVNISKTLW